MSQKITTVTIDVPYRRSGGVIFQQPVSFDLFKHDGHYSLVPLLLMEERQVANLPPELNFKMENGKPVSLRGVRDGNFHVIRDAVALIQQEQQLT